MMTEETIEKIGQLAEQLDDAMFMAMIGSSLSAEIHKTGLLATMRDVRDELIELHKENGGAEELNIQA